MEITIQINDREERFVVDDVYTTSQQEVVICVERTFAYLELLLDLRVPFQTEIDRDGKAFYTFPLDWWMIQTVNR